MGGTGPTTTTDDNKMSVIDDNKDDKIKSNAKLITMSEEKTQLDGILGLKEALKLVLNSTTQLESAIQEMLDLGVGTRLVELLKGETKDEEICYQATWLLINICCGSTMKVEEIIKLGVIDVLLQIIDNVAADKGASEKMIDIALQGVWAIGNIATDSTEHRDACLDKDAAKRIVNFLKSKSSSHEKLSKMGVWGVCRLVDKKPSPFWNQISDALPFFISVLESGANKSGCKYALWGIYYISNSYPVNVYDSGCVPLVLKYFERTEPALSFPALKICGNLASSTRDTLTDSVLKHEAFVPRLFELYNSPNEEVKIYAGWTLSNVAAGNSDQIQQLVSKPKYIDMIGAGLKNPDDRLKYQASCAIANLVSRATTDQIEQLIKNCNYLDHLSTILQEKHLDIYQRNVIEPIHKILKADVHKKIMPIFQNKGLVEQMKNASGRLTHDMKKLAQDILNEFFSGNPVAPATTAATAAKSDSSDSEDDATHGTSKVAKPSIGKKIQKAPRKVKSPKASKASAGSPSAVKKRLKITLQKKIAKKAPLRRTSTMQQVIADSKELIEGVKGRTRQSTKELSEKVKKMNEKKYAAKNAKKDDSSLLSNSRKIRRTNSMKQTLGEAKKILKQIDAQIKLASNKNDK